MSASSKKKLRKEQVAAELTEKQQKERAEAKKLKITSTVFIAIMLVIALTAVVVLSVRAYTNSGIKEKSTIAAVTGDHELNTVEFNYFFVDYVQSYYSEWQTKYGDYANMYMMMMGLDPTKSLDSQVADAETNETWADFLQNEAMTKARNTYALYDLAMSESFTLPEEEQLLLDYTLEQLEITSLTYGYRNTNDFLRAVYGPGANEKTYTEYCTISSVANAYYSAKNDSLVYDSDDIRAFDEEHPLDFTAFDYAVYYVSYSEYAEGGTEDENGILMYSDEEKATALEKAKRVADLLATSKNVEDLDKAIQGLDVNTDNPNAGTTKNKGVFYTDLSKELQEWLADESRVENDITTIPYTVNVTNEDGTESAETNGYYVVVYQGRDENLRPLANVRHLLVSFQGGTTDENGVKTYSEEEKAAAKEEAESVLQTWKDGEATEESFIALVKELTDDSSAETGGLYEDIHPDSNYIDSFLNWSLDEIRKPGDVEIIESEFGYHIMYYVSDDELTNRDRLITEHLRAQDLQEWYNEICIAKTVDIKDTSYVIKDIVMATNIGY